MFGFRRKTRQAEETRATTEVGPGWIVLGEAADAITVNARTALRCAAVYCSVKVLGETLEQLPCHAYRRLEDGGKERASDHPAEAIVSRAVNGWTTAAAWREQAMVDICLHGNHYSWIGRNARRQVTELQRIDPASVLVERDEATLEPRYVVTNKDGARRVYRFDEILHFRNISQDGLTGVSPIEAGKDAIRTALLLQQHGSKLFENGARPGGIIEGERELGSKGRERLREAFQGTFGGALNAGRTVVLDGGLKYKQLALSSVDAQFLELRRFAVLEIARLYRMPPHFLAELERATHSNAESMGQQFLSYTVLPIVKQFEGELALKLLAPRERSTVYFEFLLDDLARAAMADRFEAYAKAILNGILSPNEVRAAENLAPYLGGDQYRLPLNTEAAK